MFRFRRKMRRRGSKRYFSRHAAKSHKKNHGSRPMRGGFRI